MRSIVDQVNVLNDNGTVSNFSARSLTPVSADVLFSWHERDGAFERLAPAWQRVEIEERIGSIRDGDRTTLRVYQGPISIRWIAEHSGYQRGEKFEDKQIEGPFKRWHHRHVFEAGSSGNSWLWDDIEYTAPLGRLGAFFGGKKIEKDLKRMFAYRHRVTLQDLALHARFAQAPRQTVAITGASGLVGTTLAAMLTTGGHRVIRLVRRPAQNEDEVEWDPAVGVRDVERLSGIDAVVHLAGENIGAGRWTKKRRLAIRASRVDATERLVESLSRAESPPKAFLCASAVGYYGDTGDSPVDEGAPSGDGYLAEICRDWEGAAAKAADFCQRVIHARFGVVLSPRGGALAKMLPPFLAGGGGRVGNGQQQMSYVSIDDAAGALVHLLLTPDARGPFNIANPAPVTNREFTQTLAKVLKRPAIVPLPAAAVRILFGEMGEETLLANTGALPGTLFSSGYTFRTPQLHDALAHLLGRTERNT